MATTASNAITPAQAQPEPPAAGAIPAPPNFPVTWKEPEDAQHFWLFDRMHAPEPLPLADALSFYCAYDHGITMAARAYGLPLRGATRRINTYLYLATVPLAVPAEEAEAQSRAAEARLGAAMARLSEAWQGEYLPEIERYLAEWEAFDLAGASLPRLVQQFDASIARAERLYEIHMLLWFPFMTALSSFDDLYRDLFGQDGQDNAFGAYRLLQGFENKTVEGGRALWQLSRRALAVPAVRAVLEERAAAEVPAALEGTSQGRAFLEELRAYLDAWGRRGDRWGWSYPSWIEDPTPVIKNVQDYVGQPERDLEAEMAAQVVDRERLVAEARARLQGYPQPVIEQFEFLLRAAQAAIVLTEDHSGSPGTVRGPARVVRSLAEAGKLRPGDVLVAETTAPPWTPLFATAVAIVTDTGGILSHCAVVAREYGIPAVVGTGTATSLIHDGQLVEVDGDAGTVRLL